MLGLMGGPQGGERALLIAMRGSYRVLLEHDFDDAPGVPPGELQYKHYKLGTTGQGNTPVADTGFHFTNDGPTAADGLGGAHVGADGAHSTLDTASGHQVELNDTAKQVAIKTAGGVGGGASLTETFDDTSQTIVRTVSATVQDKLDAINKIAQSQVAANVFHQLIGGATPTATTQVSSGVKTIWDSAGNAISHVVPGGGTVALGDLASNLSAAGKGAINNDILTTFGGNSDTVALTNLQAFATALHTAGAITGAQLTAMLGILITSWLTKVGIPAGSSLVKIAV